MPKRKQLGHGFSVAIDKGGNIYENVGIRDTAVFGATTLVPRDTMHVFETAVLASYSANGDLKWAKLAPAYCCTSLAVVDSSAIFAAGNDTLYKLNVGSRVWAKTDNTSSRTTIILDKQSNVYLSTGFFYFDACIQKFNASGDSLWRTSFGRTRVAILNSLCRSTNGDILVSGVGNRVRIGNDSLVGACNQAFIARLSAMTGVVAPPLSGPLFTLHPNPAQEQVIVNISTTEPGNLRLLNTIGQQVYHQSFAAGAKEQQINVANLPEGLYYLQVQTPSGKQEAKVLVRH